MKPEVEMFRQVIHYILCQSSVGPIAVSIFLHEELRRILREIKIKLISIIEPLRRWGYIEQLRDSLLIIGIDILKKKTGFLDR